jgi:hypothetical protein
MTGEIPGSVASVAAADKTWRFTANTSKSVHKAESSGWIFKTPNL